MTALSGVKNRTQKLGGIVTENSYKMAAVKIWAGAIVMMPSTGYVTNAAASASNLGVCGIAMETVDNSAGNAGDKSIKVQSGRFEIPVTSMAVTSLGKHVYASDNDTTSITQGTNEPLVGTIEEYVSSSKAIVQVGPLSLIAAG